MHCKVCEAAKKPPAMVASHFPKNRGITVCPTLLSQQCKGCGNKGHTIKYCFPVVKVQVKSEQGKQVKLEQVKPKKAITRAITRATIDLLYVSSDEEQGDEEQGEEQAEEEQEQQKAPKESKKPKKKEPRVEPKKKFCWADAESDSSGSEDSDSD